MFVAEYIFNHLMFVTIRVAGCIPRPGDSVLAGFSSENAQNCPFLRRVSSATRLACAARVRIYCTGFAFSGQTDAHCLYAEFCRTGENFMSAIRCAIEVSRLRRFSAILWGGLFAGTFDITQAFIGFGLLGATPYQILQHIAGGIFGTRSYQMGWTSAVIGFVLHFTIAFTAATIYYVASRKVRVLVEHAVVCGLLYGEGVFLFMHFAVLPLSALASAQFNIVTYITGPVGHPFLVGLPIAFSVRHFPSPLVFSLREVNQNSG
jgi:hypothetical protein